MIRDTLPDDTPQLVQLTADTGFFKPIELEALQEVLDDYHAANKEVGHRAVTYLEQGVILGYAYYAPAAMTDRTWYLYWIAVRKQEQGLGLGGKLLSFVENDVQAQRGRLLLIETSSLPLYELTRRFYLKYGYEQTACLRDYYAAGDSMVVFAKHFEQGR